MSGVRNKRGPTHADALMASRSVMKKALAEIAYFCKDEEAAAIALQAIKDEHEAYRTGVMRAVD